MNVGETGRTVEVRLKKHKRMDWAKNGIAANTNKTLHDILWHCAEFVEQETNWLKRIFKVALRIQAEDNTVNLDLGRGRPVTPKSHVEHV